MAYILFNRTLLSSLLFLVIVAAAGAAPVITWEPPTPPDGSTTPNNWVYLNTTVSSNPDTSAFFDWDHSLVGYWSFEHVLSDGTVYDNSTYGNDGTMINFASNTTATGKYGQGLEFDGSNDYVMVGGVSSLTSGGFTGEAWIKKSGETHFAGIVNRYDHDIRGWGVWTQEDRTIRFYRASCSPGYDSRDSSSIPLNEWHHIAWTFDSSNVFFYIDGELDYTEPSVDPCRTLDTLTIGLYDASHDDYFNGFIDEVHIHNRALSGEEIRASYNNGLHSLYNNFTGLTEGTYDYTAWAIDSAGGLVRSDRSVEYLFGETSPAIALVTPLNTTYPVGTNVSLNFTYVESSPDKCVYNLDGSGNTTIAYLNGTFLVSDSGYHTLLLWCNNSAGNWGSNFTGNFTIAVAPPSNSPPTVSNPNPAIGAIGIPTDTPSLGIAMEDPDADLMDYIIVTLPDVGSCSANGIGDGDKSCNISGLDYLTIYYWYVNVTDGNSWTNESFWFTTEENTTDPAPSVILVSPSNRVDTTQTMPTFSFLVSDADNDTVNCTLFINDATTTFDSNAVADGSTTNSIAPASPLTYAAHSWYVDCTDGVNVGISTTWTLTVYNETVDENETEDNITEPPPTNESNKTVPPSENVSNQTLVSPSQNETTSNQSAQEAFCGNGVKEEDEQCDGADGVPEGGFWCSDDCELHFPGEGSIPLYYEREIDIGVAKINMFFFLAVAFVLFVIITVALVIYSNKTLKRRTALPFRKNKDGLEPGTEKGTSEENLEEPSVHSLDDIKQD